MVKFKEIIAKIKIDKAVEFCKKNVRYIGAAGCFAAILVILVFGTNGTVADNDKMAGAYQSYQENENKEVEDLIKSYLKNYAAGDVDSLKTIATPISDAEASYIQFYSQYIDKYQNIKIYTKRGVDKKSYLCSVYLQLKFKDIETPVAGLDFFYVQTDDKGKLYINNVYGSFNQANGEFDMDSDVTALIAAFEQQPDVLALQADVQKECNEAMLKDENLGNFVNGTLQQAISQWATDYKNAVAQAAQQAAEAKKAEEEEAAKKEEEAKKAEEAAKKEAEEKANAKKMISTDKINVRDSASENGNKVGQLDKGQEVTFYASENGWAKIEFNGGAAYVKEEFLKEAEQSSQETDNNEQATSNTASQAGKTITLTTTVNVRESMSETASKVAVAYAGEQVKVEQDYAEGWSKVTYKNKTGYCKTEFLK